MNIQRKDLGKSQIELSVELSAEEFAPYIEKASHKVAESVNIEGFRPGKAPLDLVKQKVGEMAILEEAAHLTVHKIVDGIIDEHIKEQQVIGQPRVDVTKLAPGNPLAFKIVVMVMPEIKLGEYKNLGVKQSEVKIDEKDVKKTLNELAESRAKEKISEEAVKEGDKVSVSIEMFLEKVPVENGQMPEAMILVGKDYFVAGFDKKLIGAKKDAELVFSLPYPEDHHLKNLAGKMVDFKVKVKEVYDREVPALDDTLASGFGFKKMTELEEFLRKTAIDRAKQQADQKTEIQMLETIIEKTKFSELPDMLVQSESDLIMSEIEQNIMQQGGRFEDYLASIKKTKEQLLMDLLPQAVKRVKSAMVLREIAKVEKMEISEEEIHHKIDEIKEQYKHDEKIQQMVKEHSYHHYLANILANQKVIKKLREWNIA